MEALQCQNCKGLCCGPVPVTEQELKKIRKKVKSMPPKLRTQLQSQNRHFGTCIFYDLDKNQCGIYSARPETCRLFGYHKDLVCMFHPQLATKELPKGFSAKRKNERMLTLDITWNDF
ncbi:YkgJ family cysteine cluster protein [Bacillus massilinigeriensis]|uniref:YkgJ family cysteine cluster protein n=1 Tax=Bacillus massilionigeriensis TaxID=1805475 RepID=UPI00096B0679|nr:YkgJ family cysteine cluster protein [Bacillus massilionigeriensis]